MSRRQARAFTLIELLTVIAISAILITLIIVPLVQSFTLTRQGQALSEAQSRARTLSERIGREISNATAVRDNTGNRGSVTIVVPGKAGGPDPEVPVTLPFAKIDIVRPAEGDPTRGPSGAFIDPATGKEDPTLTAPKGQMLLPLAPGATIIRYFVGLRRPLTTANEPGVYNNPFEQLLTPQAAGEDNLFVLYRAEVQPFVYTDTGPRVNTALFLDADNDDQPEDLDDPAFFALLPTVDYNVATRILTPSGVAKAQRIKNWLGQGRDGAGNPLGRATIVTEVSRFDMIQPVFNRRTREVTFDNVDDPVDSALRDRPRLVPLVQFRPTRISSDPAEGQRTARLGEETENATAIASDVFRTDFGGWSSTVVRTWTAYPEAWDRLDPNRNEYVVGRTDIRNGQLGFPAGFSIYVFDPDSGQEESLGGIEVFDLNTYQQSSGSGSDYPFSDAIQAADTRSGWLTDADARAHFTPYFLNPTSGKLIASFSIPEIGTTQPPSGVTLPTVTVGDQVSPLQAPTLDPTYLTAPYNANDDSFGINRCFNRVWDEYNGTGGRPNLRPDIHRFIDLRIVNQPDSTASVADGAAGPLHPDPAIGFVRARIVPGSEEIWGPDQSPGAVGGRPARYTRVTKNPGPNQYKINYVDQDEPDYALLGLPNPPPTYTPTDFMSAVYQPRFKAGYIQLNSDPSTPIPAGIFEVFYRFQFSHPGDSVAVDYDSRQVMSVQLTLRMFPQTRAPNAELVPVKTTATVRNFIR